MAIDGALDDLGFLDYLHNVLAPMLSEGDVVGVDNVRPFKIVGIWEPIAACAA